MILALLGGSFAGAVHALAGPDHLLSLAPLSLGRRGAWRVGIRWGLGHGAGTLVCAAALIAAVSALRFEGLERWAEGIAGAALLVMGGLGLRQRLVPGARGAGRGVFLVGAVHGITGGAAVLLLLPAVVSASALGTAGYLAGFVAGSTVAMAVLTAGLARISLAGGRPGAWGRKVSWAASIAALALGAFWIGRALLWPIAQAG